MNDYEKLDETAKAWRDLGNAFLEYIEEYYPENYWKHY